ncbi:hypothetical protein F5B20DRAFT_591759 [Whalleya microplaca]|nr:hypothetical protein F5B20DRAFT_591759 [Whalleya microplaca]
MAESFDIRLEAPANWKTWLGDTKPDSDTSPQHVLAGAKRMMAYLDFVRNANGERRLIGQCECWLIMRTKMGINSIQDMLNQITHGESLHADPIFDTFDESKVSKSVLSPKQSGSGVWGTELERGVLVLIKDVFIQREQRNCGLGRKLIEAVLATIQERVQVFFAIALPHCPLFEVKDALAQYLVDDVYDFDKRTVEFAIRFLRTLGFRRVGSSDWFAYAGDPDHPSRRLASKDDFDPVDRG